jgi:hypothetical protein
MSIPEDVYKKLTEILCNRKDQIFDIEILPSGFGPLLQDGISVGITKKALVQAFIVARTIFFTSLKQRENMVQCPLDEGGNGGAEDIEIDHSDAQTTVATEIMLLFDSEHLTACNWRKRRLRALKASVTSSSQYAHALKTEIAFATTLLGSPLYRHAKSPTLWQHRCWVMNQLLQENTGPASPFIPSLSCQGNSLPSCRSAFAEDILHSELSLVLKAGERHPKNYYAFSYMRELLALLGSSPVQYSRHGGCSTRLENSSLAIESNPLSRQPCSVRQSLARALLNEMHAWCLAHPRDISGWAFLAFLLEAVDDGLIQKTVVEKTVKFALDIVWEGEALWTFVDMSMTRFGLVLGQLTTLGDDVLQYERIIPVGGSITVPKRRWAIWVSRARALRTTDDQLKQHGDHLPDHIAPQKELG